MLPTPASPRTSPTRHSNSTQAPYSPGRLPPSPTALRVSSGRSVPSKLDLQHRVRPSDRVPSTSHRAPDSPPMALQPQELAQSATRPDRAKRFRSTPPVTPDRALSNSTRTLASAEVSDRSPSWLTNPGDGSFDSVRTDRSGRRPGGASPRSFGLAGAGASWKSNPSPSASQSQSLLHPRRGSSPLGPMPIHPSRLSLASTSAGGPSHQSQPSPAAEAQTRTSASRFLITVVPPLHLPHDPPHPRTPQACSGYGPPSQFRRGTLIPLYPSLGSQLGAIAREYGLPSTGGMVLYLLSTVDPNSSTNGALPSAAGLSGEGGPRIGEEAWNFLWASLFEEDALADEGSDEEDYEDEHSQSAPPVPPIPSELRAYDRRSSPLDPNDSYASSTAGASFNARTPTAEESLFSDHDQDPAADRGSLSSDAASGDADGSVFSAKLPRAPAGSRSVSAAASIGRGPPPGLLHHASRHSSGSILAHSTNSGVNQRIGSYGSQPNLRQASRQSMRSVHSRSQNVYSRAASRSASFGSSFSHASSVPSFGPGLIVGKVEFDIDTSRGNKSKWYESWLAGAEPVQSGLSTAPSSANALSGHLPSPYQRSPSHLSAEDSQEQLLSSQTTGSDQFATVRSAGTQAFAFNGRQETYLPNGLRQLELRPNELSPRQQTGFPERRTSEFVVNEVAATPTATDVETMESQQSSPAPTRIGEPLLTEDSPPLPSRRANPEMRIRTASGRSRAAESMLSGYSVAGQGGHSENDSESGIDSNRGSVDYQAFGMERSGSSNSLSAKARPFSPSGSIRSAGALSPVIESQQVGYAPLADDELDESPAHAGYAQLEGSGAEESYSSIVEHSVESSDESEYGDDAPEEQPQAHSGAADPLGDIFGEDEATWSSMGAGRPSELEQVEETTGLGIVGASVADLAGSAPAGVIERSPAEETRDELGLPPPEDDLGEVMSLLQSNAPLSAPEENPSPALNLASPIHLTSSPSAPENTGVFENTTRPTSPPAQSAPEFEPPVYGQVKTPSVTEPSPESQIPFRQGGRARMGGVDWAGKPGLPPIKTESISEANRDSMLDGLDDLERALADLSPTVQKTATQAELRNQFATPRAVTEQQPAPASAPAPIAPVEEPAEQARGQPAPVEIPAEEPVESLVSPVSPTLPHSPLLESRQPFRYASANSSPRPLDPQRQASLTGDTPAYAADSPAERAAPTTPMTPVTPRQPRTTSAAAGNVLPPAPEMIPLPATPYLEQALTAPEGEMPSEQRTPRTTSLSRSERSPNLGTQVPFDIPPPPVPTAENVSSGKPLGLPSPPRHPFSQSAKMDRNANISNASTTSSTGSTAPSSAPPKSPGTFSSLRPNKSWRSPSGNSNKSPDLASSTSSERNEDPSTEQSGSTTKSPKFKGAFGKLNIFKKDKKTVGQQEMSSPDLSASSPVEPETGSLPSLDEANLTVSPEVIAREQQQPMTPEAAFEPVRPPRTDSDQPLVAEAAPVRPPRGASLSGSTSGRRPSLGDGELMPASFESAPLPPLPVTPKFSTPLAPPPRGSSATQPSPAPSNQSFTRARMPSAPTLEVSRSQDSYRSTPSQTEHAPVYPQRQASANSSHLTSPRSEYSQRSPTQFMSPQQPSYSASAPATPMGVTGRFVPRPLGSDGRQKPRLSEDLSQLLSQMDDFDLGEEQVPPLRPVKESGGEERGAREGVMSDDLHALGSMMSHLDELSPTSPEDARGMPFSQR